VRNVDRHVAQYAVPERPFRRVLRIHFWKSSSAASPHEEAIRGDCCGWWRLSNIFGPRSKSLEAVGTLPKFRGSGTVSRCLHHRSKNWVDPSAVSRTGVETTGICNHHYSNALASEVVRRQ
jgi:hypothetical protein